MGLPGPAGGVDQGEAQHVLPLRDPPRVHPAAARAAGRARGARARPGGGGGGRGGGDACRRGPGRGPRFAVVGGDESSELGLALGFCTRREIQSCQVKSIGCSKKGFQVRFSDRIAEFDR